MGSRITLSIQKAYSISSTTATPHTQLPSPHSSTTTITQPNLTSTPATTKPAALAPRANPITATAAKDTPVNITLTGSRSTSNPLKFLKTIKPSHSTLGPISSAGSFSASVTYTPKKHYIGTDSLWFKVRDSIYYAQGKFSCLCAYYCKLTLLSGTVQRI